MNGLELLGLLLLELLELSLLLLELGLCLLELCLGGLDVVDQLLVAGIDLAHVKQIVRELFKALGVEDEGEDVRVTGLIAARDAAGELILFGVDFRLLGVDFRLLGVDLCLDFLDLADGLVELLVELLVLRGDGVELGLGGVKLCLGGVESVGRLLGGLCGKSRGRRTEHTGGDDGKAKHGLERRAARHELLRTRKSVELVFFI